MGYLIPITLAIVIALLAGCHRCAECDSVARVNLLPKEEISGRRQPENPCVLSDDAMKKRMPEVRPLMEKAVQCSEQTDGFILRFLDDDKTARALFDFVMFEKRCCAFVTYAIRFEPQNGSIFLELYSRDGAKDFLRGMLTEMGVLGQSQ